MEHFQGGQNRQSWVSQVRAVLISKITQKKAYYKNNVSSNWASGPPEKFEKFIPSHFIQFTYFSFIICYTYSYNHLIF